MKMDKEEKKLLESIDKDEWMSKMTSKKRGEVEQIAKNTLVRLKKNQRINIRVNEGDLEKIKVRALEEGIPYQTLVSSIIHKYVSGRLVEKPR